jgi:hypothetical protein
MDSIPLNTPRRRLQFASISLQIILWLRNANRKGIKANPDKINVIVHMKPPGPKKRYRDSQVES